MVCRFPFDTQGCLIEFFFVMHGMIQYTQKIKFVLLQSSVDLHLDEENPGWNLISSEV